MDLRTCSRPRAKIGRDQEPEEGKGAGSTGNRTLEATSSGSESSTASTGIQDFST